jgi:hypothetical protein
MFERYIIRYSVCVCMFVVVGGAAAATLRNLVRLTLTSQRVTIQIATMKEAFFNYQSKVPPRTVHGLYCIVVSLSHRRSGVVTLLRSSVERQRRNGGE